MSLPPNASEASRRRYELAIHLVQSCPPELGDEIALTGSTARGLADDDSDLELNLWGETLPLLEARVAWLQAAGVQEIEVFKHPRPDDSYWIGARVEDVPLEVGWQAYETVEAYIRNLLAGGMEQPLAYILVNAIPFRTKRRLAQWQKSLLGYSDVVQTQIFEHTIHQWAKRDRLQSTFKLARRGERLAFSERLLADLNLVVNLLYAVNRRWQPSRKWTLTVAADLPLMPERWRERIDDALTAPPEECVRPCIELMLDALALVPPEYDVSVAVAALSEAMRSGDYPNR